VSSKRRGHLRPLLLHSSSARPSQISAWREARAALPTVAARTQIVSAAGIWLDDRKSVRPIFCALQPLRVRPCRPDIGQRRRPRRAAASRRRWLGDCYASTNYRSRQPTSRAVCSKRVTLLGNVGRPNSAGELTKRQDVKRAGIRARGDMIGIPLPNILD
jgi:hypothetical protein